MENAMLKNSIRLVWLDQLKAISMYMVILGHSLLKFKKYGLCKFIYSFHMPLFFMISGFTFNPYKYSSVIDCVKDKLIKLAYPYVMLNLLVIPLWYINMETGMIAEDSFPTILSGILYSNNSVFRAPSNATWFIMTLFLAEIIYYTLFYFFRDDKSVFLMSCILCVIGVIAPLEHEVHDAPFHLDVSLVAQFFYGCGHLLRKNFNLIQEFFNNNTCFKVVVLILTGVLFCFLNKNVDFSVEVYSNFIYTLISSFTISITLFYLFAKLDLHSKILSYIGKNTIIILAFHLLVLRVLQAFYPFLKTDELYALIASFIVYILMIPTIWIVNKFFCFMVVMPIGLKNRVEKIL